MKLAAGGLGTDNRDPFLQCLGDELRSVAGPDVSRNAPQEEEVGQTVGHIDDLELAGDTDTRRILQSLRLKNFLEFKTGTGIAIAAVSKPASQEHQSKSSTANASLTRPSRFHSPTTALAVLCIGADIVPQVIKRY
jgi:hypothetical protein